LVETAASAGTDEGDGEAEHEPGGRNGSGSCRLLELTVVAVGPELAKSGSSSSFFHAFRSSQSGMGMCCSSEGKGHFGDFHPTAVLSPIGARALLVAAARQAVEQVLGDVLDPSPPQLAVADLQLEIAAPTPGEHPFRHQEVFRSPMKATAMGFGTSIVPSQPIASQSARATLASGSRYQSCPGSGHSFGRYSGAAVEEEHQAVESQRRLVEHRVGHELDRPHGRLPHAHGGDERHAVAARGHRHLRLRQLLLGRDELSKSSFCVMLWNAMLYRAPLAQPACMRC
jgi:hypothetical protein